MIRQLDGDEDFESNYPCRYLQAEDGEGQGGYLEKKSVRKHLSDLLGIIEALG